MGNSPGMDLVSDYPDVGRRLKHEPASAVTKCRETKRRPAQVGQE